jgi:hypothetical protein
MGRVPGGDEIEETRSVLYRLAAVLLSLLVAPCVLAAEERTDPSSQPKELGLVHWYRDLEKGIQSARAADKPLFLQFQEVPG